MALPRWPRGFPALRTPHQRFDELRVIDAGAAYVAVAVEDARVCTEVTCEPRAVRRRGVPVVGGIPNHHSLARQLDVSGIDPNQASRSEGFELEMRWQATERMSVIAAYTNLEVVNLNTLGNGGRFSFLGAGDLPDTDSTTFYGGTVGGFVTLASNPDAVRAAFRNTWPPSPPGTSGKTGACSRASRTSRACIRAFRDAWSCRRTRW